MYCSKCGSQLQNEAFFCPKCGNEIQKASTDLKPKEVKVMLDPSEVVKHKEVSDSSKSISGHAGTLGLILMILSIVFSLVSMLAIGFDAFIPITICSTVLFVVGFLIRMFCP